MKQSERQVYLTLIVRFGLLLKSRKILRDINNYSENKNKKDAKELKKLKKTFNGNKNKLTKPSLINNNKIVRIERESTDNTRKK
jgi:hypothetical protein